MPSDSPIVTSESSVSLSGLFRPQHRTHKPTDNKRIEMFYGKVNIIPNRCGVLLTRTGAIKLGHDIYRRY